MCVLGGYWGPERKRALLHDERYCALHRIITWRGLPVDCQTHCCKLYFCFAIACWLAFWAWTITCWTRFCHFSFLNTVKHIALRYKLHFAVVVSDTRLNSFIFNSRRLHVLVLIRWIDFSTIRKHIIGDSHEQHKQHLFWIVIETIHGKPSYNGPPLIFFFSWYREWNGFRLTSLVLWRLFKPGLVALVMRVPLTEKQEIWWFETGWIS